MLSKIGGKFSLEPVKDKHLEFIYNFRRSLIRKWFFDDRLFTWEEHLTWYENYVTNYDKLYVICDESASIYIGTVGFIDYQITHKIIEFGRFGINDKTYLGKGYATLILWNLFDEVFKITTIEAIVCEVIAENRIVSLYVKLGFVINGYEENYQCYPGRTVNKVSMILAKERFNEDYRY